LATAVRFNASGDYLRITSSLPDYNSAWTWCGWVYIASNTGAGYQAIFTFSGGGSAYDELFINASAALAMEVGNGASTTTTGSTLSVGQWYHISIVRESNASIKVYVNASATADSTNTRSVSGRTAAGNLSLATNAFSEWADMRVAYARMWTAALSTSELAAEKNSATAVRSTALWASWPLQADPNDTSGNARNFTAGGTLTYSESGPTLPVTVAPAAAAAASTAVAPTVVAGGAVSVTPAAAAATSTAVAPAVVYGAITVAAAAAAAASTAVAPAVVYGAVTVAPAAAAATSTAVAPAVIASGAIVPAAATATSTAVAPAVVYGAVTVAPAAAAAASTAVAPAVVIGVILAVIWLSYRRQLALASDRQLDLSADRSFGLKFTR
jgi:hypothetical protein